MQPFCLMRRGKLITPQLDCGGKELERVQRRTRIGAELKEFRATQVVV
jgi:hypothetical protein